MAVSIVAGASGLMQLGLSISDLALLVDQGRKFCNFLCARQNDDDLFETLGEDREALLRRPGLANTSKMEHAWPRIGFVHQGVKKKGEIVANTSTQEAAPLGIRWRKTKNTPDGVDSFTWVMVAIVSALDECLPSSEIQELLIRVFVTVLDRDDDIDTVLRIHIRRNIESWRSSGCARDIAYSIKQEMRKSLTGSVPGPVRRESIPQLNEAETKDTENMLVWLFGGDLSVFNAMSPITFAIAEAWRKVKLDLCTDGNPKHERQACIVYHPQGQLRGGSSCKTLSVPRGLGTRALQISWPRNKPESMIDALGVERRLENLMFQAWQYGTEAADGMELFGKADGPYEDTKEVYYTLEISSFAYVSKRYGPHIGMLADQGFPGDSEKIYKALEWLLVGEPSDSSRWLHNHIGRDYLFRIDNTHIVTEKKYISVFFKYQALMYGFFYQLLRQILSFDLVEPTAFFYGIWGVHSTTFLAICTQLGHSLRNDGQASRAHILYVLAAMYNSRPKIFHANSSTPRLVGIIGSVSLLALPLIRTTDIPKEIWKIAVVDLPIVDLDADNADGELMASEGGGVRFVSTTEDNCTGTAIQPTGPSQKWTVHPYMSIALGGEKASGVVMAARCGKRLVGWFNPLAADISFLSSAYLQESYDQDDVVAFEVRDQDWQSGKVPQPDANRLGFEFGVVRSHNSPSLRYAAAGFYAETGEEIAIARSADEFCGAFGRIQGQGRGVVIA